LWLKIERELRVDEQCMMLERWWASRIKEIQTVSNIEIASKASVRRRLNVKYQIRQGDTVWRGQIGLK
jgi:hypothetical protein